MKALLELGIQDLFSNGIKKAGEMIDQLSAKVNNIGGSGSNPFDSLSGSMKKFQRDNAQMVSALTDEVPGLDKALTLMSNPYVATAAAVTAVGTASVAAYKDFSEWNALIAKVNVTAEKSGPALEKMSDDLQNIAGDSGVTDAFKQVPEAFNKLVSSGMEYDDALKTLEPTIKASKANFTDLGLVAETAAGIMNSTGIKDANKVFDVLQATMKKGNVEFQDMAQYLPKIIPTALQVGMSLEDVGGAYAFLTAKGQSAETAATGIQNLAKAFGDMDRVKDFGKSGIDLFNTDGSRKKIDQVIESVASKMDKFKTDQEKTKFLDSLGLDMEAATALASLTADAQGLNKALEYTRNSAGQLAKAVVDGARSGESWDKIQTKLGDWWLDFGKLVTPLFDWIGDKTLAILNGLEKWAEPVGAFIDLVWDLGKAFYTGFGTFNAFWDGFKNFASWLGSSFMDELYRVLDTVTGIFKTAQGLVNLDMTQAQEGLDKVTGAWTGDNKAERERQAKIDALYAKAEGKMSEDSKSGTGVFGKTKAPGLANFAKREAASTAAITGGGKETRNINVTIQRMNGIENSNFKGTPQEFQDLEQKFQEMLMRVIAGTEASIANQ